MKKGISLVGIWAKLDLQYLILIVCLFVKSVFDPLEKFSLIWRRYHYQCRASNFDLYMAIEQRGFFSVPHILWHYKFGCNGQFWGSVTLIPIRSPLQDSTKIQLTLSKPNYVLESFSKKSLLKIVNSFAHWTEHYFDICKLIILTCIWSLKVWILS